MVRRHRESRVWGQRRIAPGIGTDRPFDRISDSAATRHPVGGTTRRRIGPNVGGPFDVRTVRRGHARAHRPTVMYGHGQTSVKRLAHRTRRRAKRGLRPGGGRERRGPPRPRAGASSVTARGRGAARRANASRLTRARRGPCGRRAGARRRRWQRRNGRRGAERDLTPGNGLRDGSAAVPAAWRRGAYLPYPAPDGMPYPPDGPCGPPGSADGIPLTT